MQPQILSTTPWFTSFIIQMLWICLIFSLRVSCLKSSNNTLWKETQYSFYPSCFTSCDPPTPGPHVPPLTSIESQAFKLVLFITQLKIRKSPMFKFNTCFLHCVPPRLTNCIHHNQHPNIVRSLCKTSY